MQKLIRAFKQVVKPSEALYDRRDPFPNGGPEFPWPEPWKNYFVAFLGSFIAIAIPSYVSFNSEINLLLISMGASAVLFYASPNVPLTQPRNVLFGNLVSAFVGLCCRLIVGALSKAPEDWFWLSASCAVSISISLMLASNNIYPPGGATALATAILPQVPSAGGGFIWLVTPVLVGTLFQLTLAIFMNNFLVSTRHYPDRWW